MRHHADTITDPMDKKLLLAIQYACNTSGVTVPWDRVGTIMGPEITAGAVIQHLAKVRVRLVEDGHPVPPPLRRGGSGRNTTAASTPKKNGVTKAPKTKQIRKKLEPKSDDSSKEQSDWKDGDSDMEYGKPRAKRTKSNAKVPNGRRLKKEASHDEDADEDTNEELVATGAGFLALEDDSGTPPKTEKKSPSNKKSLIVALPSTAGGIKDEDADMSANEQEAEANGGLVIRGLSHGDFSSSPYGQNFADLAAAQMEPTAGPINTSSYVGAYNNMHTSPQVSTFNGGLYRTNKSLFQQTDDDLDFNFINPGAQVPIDFNSAEYLNKVGVINTGTNFNGTYDGGAQQSDFGYQPTNANHESPNVFGNDDYGHLPTTHWSNDNSFAGSSMATQWSNDNGYAGSSMATTANQTPAETSAGTDFGGYFPAAQFQADAFDGAAYDPSASHGIDSLNTGFFPNGFGDEYSGNGSYLA